MNRTLIVIIFLSLVLLNSVYTTCKPDCSIPSFVESALSKAEVIRDSALRAMSEAENKGLLFYDIEEAFDTAEKYFKMGIGNISQGKYYLAKFNLVKASSLYSQVISMCESNIFNTTIATLVVFFIVIGASFAIASLIVERRLLFRFIVSSLTTLIGLYLLYQFHPGFAIILPPNDPIMLRKLLFYSSLYVALFYLVFVEVPQNLAPLPTPETPHFWGAVSMAFHIAANSLRKRKLRTSLTLLTVILSVTAFIAFISVTPGLVIIHSLIARKTSAVKPSVSTDVSTYLSYEYRALYDELLENPKIAHLYKSVSYPRLSTTDKDGWVNLYYLRAVNGEGKFGVQGVIAITPSLESYVIPLDSIIVKGRLMRDDEHDAVLISNEASRALGVDVDDYVALCDPLSHREILRLKVVGVFSGSGMEELYDTTGRPYRTYSYRITEATGNRVSWELVPSKGSKVIVLNYKGAFKLNLKLSRIAILARNISEAEEIAESLAEYLDLGVSLAYDGKSFLVSQLTGYRVTGTTSIIPIAICYLIIANSMLTSIYERRREFSTFSALGLNPSHIKYLLMTEAILLGLSGGGIGYLTGLSLANVIVRSKLLLGLKINITPMWATTSLVLSMLLMILSVIYPAEKASLQVVPSLERRWRFKGNIKKAYTEDLPSRVEAYLIEDFVDFVRRRVEAAFPPYALYLRSTTRVEEVKKEDVHRIDIVINAEIISEISSSAEFRITCERGFGERFYELKLSIKPISIAGSRYKWLVYSVTDEIRKAILAWQAIYKSEKGRRVPWLSTGC